MKKGLLRALSAVVAISMLLCMSMVAFADVTTTAVVTTYQGANVTVRTDVTGAVGSEQVAFLVEKAIGEDTKIIWIDQQTADKDGKASSTFTAAAEDAIDATVKVGTSSIAASASSTDTIAWDEYTVTWTVEGTTAEHPSKVVAYVGETEKTGSSATVAQNNAKVTFYILAAANEELVTINGETPSLVGDAFVATINETSVKDFTFVFAPKTVEAEVAPSANVDVANGVVYNSTEKYASVTAKAIDATEYGILVALDAEDLTESAVTSAPTGGTEAANGASIIKLHALGSNAENVFVIKIDDSEGKFFTGSQYWAAVYTINANGVAVSAPFELN